MKNSPRLIQTFLIDGTIEGARIIEISQSSVKAFVIPRLHLGDMKDREELNNPALYFLINADEQLAYIGESENFRKRLTDHTRKKEFWDVAIAIVSNHTNGLEKSDVKYLESLSVERAQQGSMKVQNKTAPIKNNVHEFKLHTLNKIIDDVQLVLTSLGYDILATQKSQTVGDRWYLAYKDITATGEFRGDKFVILKGSIIYPKATDSWRRDFPKQNNIRETIIANSEHKDDKIVITENISCNSVSMAAGLIIGSHINGWNIWKNTDDKSMDEVIRKS